MNRRSVAGVVLVTALLPGCFLFGSEEPKAEAPVGEGGSGGGGGGGGELCTGGPPAAERGRGYLVTDGTDGVVLPLDAEFARCAAPVDAGFTFELWVRPLPVPENRAACFREPPDLCRPGAATFNAELCASQLPECVPGNEKLRWCGRTPGCVAEDEAFDVCGPIARIEASDGRQFVGVDLEGTCVSVVAGSTFLDGNPSRWTVPAGAWTHLVVRGGMSAQDDWVVDRGVNGTTGGDVLWPDGPLVYSGLQLRLGGVSGGGAAIQAAFDEVRFRRDRLSDNDLKRDARGEPVSGPLVSWWSFDDLGDEPSDPVELFDHAAGSGRVSVPARLVAAGGVERSPPFVPNPACRDDGAGLDLLEDGSLVACRRPIVAIEQGLESTTLAPLCGRGFHHCRMDEPAVLAWVARPEGPEGAPGCFVLSSLRAATLNEVPGQKYDENLHLASERTCSNGCGFPDGDLFCGPTCGLTPDGGDDDPVFDPERLALGLACEIDRPFSPNESCPAVGLPALRAPENEAVNDCSQQQFTTDGVACCRD